MSDKKKEIHVRDLVIKAENVIFEPPKHRRVDPFFGPRRFEDDRDDVEVDVDVDVDVDVKDDESPSDDDRRRRRPFSWI
jgi:hypothetical protein